MHRQTGTRHAGEGLRDGQHRGFREAVDRREVVDQLVRLYTNPGEIIFSPFTGIGSEGFVSLRRGRRFYGVELKPEYRLAAIANLERAMQMSEASQQTLFDAIDVDEEVAADHAEVVPHKVAFLDAPI